MAVETSLNQAKRLENKGKLKDAAEIYSGILAKFPKNTKAKAALDALANRTDTAGDPPPAVRSKLTATFKGRQFAETASVCAELLQSYKESFFLWNVLGTCYLELSKIDQAVNCLEKAASLKGNAVATLILLGRALIQQRDFARAIATFIKVLNVNPRDSDTLNNLGTALLGAGRQDEALECFKTASQLDPDNHKAICNTALISELRGDLATARKLLEFTFDNGLREFKFVNKIAKFQFQMGDFAAALNTYAELAKIDPANQEIRALALHVKGHMCDWSYLKDYDRVATKLGLEGKGVPPFIFFSLDDNPGLLRERTEKYAASNMPAPVTMANVRTITPREKIRVGLFSSDFHDHATMHLMGGLFDSYDRDRFEFFAYSGGMPRNDWQRQRVIDNVTQFRDIATLTDPVAAKLAQDDELDIAIDLKGYTGDTRSTLFVNRLAPVQIAYLGFPGTQAHPAFDYMITDHIASPPQFREGYSEKLIYMPESYQINDRNRQIAETPVTRSSQGLPEKGFVFACLNNNYKITPREFDIWMRLLQNTEDSVLWLMRLNEWCEDNLRREASARGVDPDRLVFASKVKAEEHLARQSCADLFLDTFNVNAHTTASDALWTGLPVLTLAGKQFAARVAASLLTAAGLPELVTETEAAYEALALTLAHNPDRLGELRDRLKSTRMTMPLFDTPRFTRHFEDALETVYDRAAKGLPPEDFSVAPRS